MPSSNFVIKDRNIIKQWLSNKKHHNFLLRAIVLRPSNSNQLELKLVLVIENINTGIILLGQNKVSDVNIKNIIIYCRKIFWGGL